MIGRSHTRTGRSPVVAAIAAAAGGLLLAACSSSPSAVKPSTTTSTTSTSPTPAGSSTTPASSTTTSPRPSPTPVCPSTGLALAEDNAKSAGGAGSADLAFTLTNTTSSPCLIDGFAAVQFRGTTTGTGPGPVLSLTTRDTGASASRVALDAHGVAAFYLVVGNVPVDGVGCATVGSIDVTPPGAGSALSVAASFSACGPSVGVTAIELLASLRT